MYDEESLRKAYEDDDIPRRPMPRWMLVAYVVCAVGVGCLIGYGLSH